MIINLLNLFFPEICLACDSQLGDKEKFICTFCRHNLPLTNFHSDFDNAVAKRLYGRVNFKHATALLWFNKKGIVQHLLHNLKYKGHEEVGLFLGQWLGADLNQLVEYKDIDLVIPVPLHKSRLRQRGYNQVDTFGKEIAKALGVPYNNSVLKKVKSTKTQVFKDRLKRILTNETFYTVTENESLNGKHILLVDDIITTGATLEACTNALLKIDGVSISIATMAITE